VSLMPRRPPTSPLFPYTTLFRSGDVHGDVLDQLLEGLGAGDEVGLAVDLDEDADLPAGVDVGADGPLGGDAAGLLGGGKIGVLRSEEHTSELQSLTHIVCRPLLD